MEKEEKKLKGWQKKLITIAILVAAAYFLGQLAVPVLMKAIFL